MSQGPSVNSWQVSRVISRSNLQVVVLAMEDIGMLAPVNTLFRSYHRVKTVQTALSRLQFGLVKCDQVILLGRFPKTNAGLI